MEFQNTFVVQAPADGPMTMNYKGDIEILERDADAYRAMGRRRSR